MAWARIVLALWAGKTPILHPELSERPNALATLIVLLLVLVPPSQKGSSSRRASRTRERVVNMRLGLALHRGKRQIVIDENNN